MDTFEGTNTVKTALLLSSLLFQRPGEIRAMEWAEINWDAKQWEIPAEKMKMRQPHIVPLSKQALALLRDLQPYTEHRGPFVFPSARGASRCLSDNAVRVALRTIGYTKEQMTPHGFRATARTLLDEVLNYRLDWIEHQLAHAVKDTNGRAYNRTAHLKGRAEMMQGWADYLDNLKAQAKAGNVITAKFGTVE
jgi:integrase